MGWCFKGIESQSSFAFVIKCKTWIYQCCWQSQSPIGDGAPLQFDSSSELDVVREFIKEDILQVKVDVQQQFLLKLQMNKKI
jgi:hypothetical protein